MRFEKKNVFQHKKTENAFSCIAKNTSPSIQLMRSNDIFKMRFYLKNVLQTEIDAFKRIEDEKQCVKAQKLRFFPKGAVKTLFHTNFFFVGNVK